MINTLIIIKLKVICIMLDIGKPSWIFYTLAAFLILCMIVVLLSGRAARRIAGRH